MHHLLVQLQRAIPSCKAQASRGLNKTFHMAHKLVYNHDCTKMIAIKVSLTNLKESKVHVTIIMIAKRCFVHVK